MRGRRSAINRLYLFKIQLRMTANRPRSRHILVRQSTSGARARGALRIGVTIMTAIKTNKPVDHDHPTRENGVEGEIREFVRRDGQGLRRAPDSDSEVVAHNISTLLQRVAGTSVQEVDRLIVELQGLRELLQTEGARVQREITEYAHLSQSAMQSTKIITDSLANWKGDGGRGVRG